MASKKDYVRTAEILAQAERETRETAQGLIGIVELDTLKYYRAKLIELFSQEYKKDNPRFNAQRFADYILKELGE